MFSRVSSARRWSLRWCAATALRRAADRQWTHRGAEADPLGLATRGPRSDGSSTATAAGGSNSPTRSWSPRTGGRLGQRRGHSSASANVAYGGPGWSRARRTLARAGLGRDRTAVGPTARPRLETGLLEQSDWTAKWIAAPADGLDLSGDKLDLVHGDDAANNMPAMTATCARPSPAANPPRGRFLFTVDDEAIVYVNGTQVIDTKAMRDNDENAWQKAQLDVTSLLKAGANTIAVQVKNRLNPSGDQTPGGFIARLKADGTTLDTSAPGRRARPATTAGSSPASTTPPGRPRASSPPTAAARGAQRQPPGPAQPVPAQGLHGRPSRSRRRACTSPRSASTRSTSTAQGRRRTCSRPAGRSTPSASRPRPTTSRPRQAGRQRDRRDPRRRLVRRRLQGGKKWGTNPRCSPS